MQKRQLVGRVPPLTDKSTERPMCGAKTKQTGNPCTNVAMANGRCRLHGGKSTGPKKPNKPMGNSLAQTHGLYAVGMYPEEMDMYGTIAIGSLQDEIRIAKILLRRAMRAQLMWEMARGEIARANSGQVRQVMLESGLWDVDELTTETGVAGVDKDGNIIDIDKQRIVRRKTDFANEIRQYQRLLVSLEAEHARLQEGGQDDDTVAQLAEDLRLFTDNAGPLMPGGKV
jgi:hypothetical protein